MSTATISGGLYVGLSLNSSQTFGAQKALGALDANYTIGAVLSDLSQSPEAGAFNVFQITPTEGGNYTLPYGVYPPPFTSAVSSIGQVLALEGSNDASINGNRQGGPQILIGNAGNDAVNPNHGGGTIILGSGNNTVNIIGPNSAQDITSGPGQNTINLRNTSTSIFVSGSGQDTVNVGAGNVTISSTVDLVINSRGNDTITLGAGNDTVMAMGAATVVGGTGDLVFQGGTDSNVTAGSGSETVFGGKGATLFYGSNAANGADSMVGGSGINFFEGGNGRDTMVSGAGLGASSDIFDFASSVAGGNHTIVGFSAGTDQIDLQGYAAADISSLTYGGGNSTITLNDGTTITVNGFHLGNSDIKFTR